MHTLLQQYSRAITAFTLLLLATGLPLTCNSTSAFVINNTVLEQASAHPASRGLKQQVGQPNKKALRQQKRVKRRMARLQRVLGKPNAEEGRLAKRLRAEASSHEIATGLLMVGGVLTLIGLLLLRSSHQEPDSMGRSSRGCLDEFYGVLLLFLGGILLLVGLVSLAF